MDADHGGGSIAENCSFMGDPGLSMLNIRGQYGSILNRQIDIFPYFERMLSKMLTFSS